MATGTVEHHRSFGTGLVQSKLQSLLRVNATDARQSLQSVLRLAVHAITSWKTYFFATVPVDGHPANRAHDRLVYAEGSGQQALAIVREIVQRDRGPVSTILTSEPSDEAQLLNPLGQLE